MNQGLSMNLNDKEANNGRDEEQQEEVERNAEDCIESLAKNLEKMGRSETFEEGRRGAVIESTSVDDCSECTDENIWKSSSNERKLIIADMERRFADVEDPIEGPSGWSPSRDSFIDVSLDTSSSSQVIKMPLNVETGETSLRRYGNYLQRYGPQLERYGNQLERFEHHLERIGPQLERCENNLERYGLQLEVIGRQLQRPSTERINSTERRNSSERENRMMVLPDVHTQTESGNEGYAPLSVDSCHGSGVPTHSVRHGTWVGTQINPRRLSRRPSFQVDDGLIRHWMRRRNTENRDTLPSRFREDRRRSVWRNDGDLRRVRGGHWRGVDGFVGRRYQQANILNADIEYNNYERSIRRSTDRQDHGQCALDRNRMRRNENVHHDDPNFGFVLIDSENTPGPSRSDATAPQGRRPRSHMSLRSLNDSLPSNLGPIFEYNVEPEEENNDQRQNIHGRRTQRRRDDNNIRSWMAMNRYLQAIPLYIGQGDSKAMDSPHNLLTLPTNETVQNGPGLPLLHEYERNRIWRNSARSHSRRL